MSNIFSQILQSQIESGRHRRQWLKLLGELNNVDWQINNRLSDDIEGLQRRRSEILTKMAQVHQEAPRGN